MSGAARHILTLNAGSGSLHVDLFGWQGDAPLAEHTSDWRGEGGQHDYAATGDAVASLTQHGDEWTVTDIAPLCGLG